MMKQIFTRACVAAGIVLLGACSQKPDTQALNRDREIDEQAKIAKFIDDSYIPGSHSISPAGMTAAERVQVLRFIDIAGRGNKTAEKYNETIIDFQYMENHMNAPEDSPRISRLDYLEQLARMNSVADPLLAEYKVVSKDGQNEQLKHCGYLQSMRDMEPVITARDMQRSYPAVYLEGTYKGIETKPHSTNFDFVSAQEDLKQLFYRARTLNNMDLVAYKIRVDEFEGLVTRFGTELEDFRVQSAPDLDKIRARFAGFRHKELLMQVNLEFCSKALLRVADLAPQPK